MMKVIKRDKTKQDFILDKIFKAIEKAYKSVGDGIPYDIFYIMGQDYERKQGYFASIMDKDEVTVEEIQDIVERYLKDIAPYKVMKAYILYREKHKESRAIKERLEYMCKYMSSGENAATSSETDANANVTIKNVANLEGEVYKTTNRVVQRQRMKDKLQELFPEVAKQYIEDLEHHIIYAHDEATTPTLKNYCYAVSLYPLMQEGVGNMDGITPSPPNDLQSFSGQLNNLIFLLSSQCKGAVAVGEYFVVLNYYIVKEFGEDWYNKLDNITTTSECNNQRTIRDHIYKAFKSFIYGINQPAGNRSYQSPSSFIWLL